MKRAKTARLLLAFVALIGVAELVLRSQMKSPLPGREGRFWDGNHELFGVWRPADTTKRHKKKCFSVTYQTNSVGARDIERSLTSDAPRTVVLGDSFVEGWGLPDSARLSNLLEELTGVEHLNFGMSHFSPYQSYIVYRELASQYDHDTVIIGVTPESDFVDLSLSQASAREGYAYFYRPYLMQAEGGFEHVELRENPLRRLVRHNSYLFHAMRHLFYPRQKPEVVLQKPSEVESLLHDYDEEGLAVLTRCLELTIAEAGARRVIVVLMPVYKDFVRCGAVGPGGLARALAPLEQLGDVVIVDLLPSMAAQTPDASGYYFSCDAHWDADGNAAAVRALAPYLR
jgi:hypothetical protein